MYHFNTWLIIANKLLTLDLLNSTSQHYQYMKAEVMNEVNQPLISHRVFPKNANSDVHTLPNKRLIINFFLGGGGAAVSPRVKKDKKEAWCNVMKTDSYPIATYSFLFRIGIWEDDQCQKRLGTSLRLKGYVRELGLLHFYPLCFCLSFR